MYSEETRAMVCLIKVKNLLNLYTRTLINRGDSENQNLPAAELVFLKKKISILFKNGNFSSCYFLLIYYIKHFHKSKIMVEI